MTDFIKPTTIIAVATFLWYRKGRLWNFYDSLLSESIEQITTDSIDRLRWEQIALEQCDKLSKELFNSLFRFEIEYLRHKILKNKHSLWIADSSDDGNTQRTYTDKKKYCRHMLEQIFLSDFRFCGFLLLVNAIKYRACVKKDKDPGYIEVKKS